MDNRTCCKNCTWWNGRPANANRRNVRTARCTRVLPCLVSVGKWNSIGGYIGTETKWTETVDTDKCYKFDDVGDWNNDKWWEEGQKELKRELGK